MSDGLLRRVAGQIAVSQSPPAGAAQRRVVALDQPRERRAVALSRQAHQLPVMRIENPSPPVSATRGRAGYPERAVESDRRAGSNSLSAQPMNSSCCSAPIWTTATSVNPASTNGLIALTCSSTSGPHEIASATSSGVTNWLAPQNESGLGRSAFSSPRPTRRSRSELARRGGPRAWPARCRNDGRGS